MLENLYELNRILLTVNDLALKDVGAKEESVVYSLNRYSINAKHADHKKNIDACVAVGLARRRNDRIILTSKGQRFFQLRTIEKNGETIITPNQEQKKFFLQLLFDAVKYRTALQDILSSFRFDFNKRTWFYDSRIPNRNWSPNLVNILFLCDFLESANERIEITKDNNYYISKVRHKISRSEEQLYDILKSQRATGEIAEQLTVEYEQRRLLRDGFKDLSLAVQRISKEDVFAGYDIISYNGKKSTLEHDRFIEVKGTSGSDPIFYWSKNEIEVARSKGKQYWIYLWTQVKSASEASLFKIVQDPYRKLFQQSSNKPDPVLYAVELER